MESLKIGHYTNLQLGTGLTVFLFDEPKVGSYLICGSSPATRELHTLDVDSNINEVNGLVFTGGSAYGLDATEGVMRFFQEQKQGKMMPHGVVPIVPGAAIYDLAVKTSNPPTAEDAYQACLTATNNNAMQGQIGCGTGASIGKVVPETQRMTGGFGFAEIRLENGLTVTAFAAVNAMGDIRQNGKIIAGARLPNQEFADCQKFLCSGGEEKYVAQTNTTLVVIFTNAKFNKIELKRIAKMAVSGMGQVISPAFTRYDGDIIFCFSLGEQIASELTVGAIAIEMVKQAIINAVQGSITI